MTFSPLVSLRRCCRARTEPSTTGSTISRWDGLNASDRCTGPPAVEMSDEKPLWYFTSPSEVASAAAVPSNSANRSFGDLPRVLTRTLSRPRCAMPITSSSTPWAPARCTISSMHGISVSPPSSEKRFCPT